MASNELGFQSELIDLIEWGGGHAFKASNRFLAGVHDIHYTLPGFGSGFIECKYEKDVNLDAQADAHVKLTPLQQKFARDEAKAGGVTFGAVYCRGRGRQPIRAIRFFHPLARVAYATGGLVYPASVKWYRDQNLLDVLKLWHNDQRQAALYGRTE